MTAVLEYWVGVSVGLFPYSSWTPQKKQGVNASKLRHLKSAALQTEHLTDTEYAAISHSRHGGEDLFIAEQ